MLCHTASTRSLKLYQERLTLDAAARDATARSMFSHSGRAQPPGDGSTGEAANVGGEGGEGGVGVLTHS